LSGYLTNKQGYQEYPDNIMRYLTITRKGYVPMKVKASCSHLVHSEVTRGGPFTREVIEKQMIATTTGIKMTETSVGILGQTYG